MRDRTYEAVVLRTRSFTEAAREVVFLTREEGILRATLYGNAKSKLRAHASPFNYGALYIYHDPVRDSNKVTDFDCRLWHPGLREAYDRVIAAGEVARITLLGIGGDFPAALDAVLESLAALEAAAPQDIRPILIHFRWRWAGILGIRPNVYGGFPASARLGEGAVKWLSTVESLHPHDLKRFKMDARSENEADEFCKAVLSR